MSTLISKNIEETQKIASDWILAKIKAKAKAEAEAELKARNDSNIIGLSGHLGAGKTAFVKCVAKELGIKDEITSPTFVIMKIYPITSNWPWKKLIHIDLYRLNSIEEMKALDFESLKNDPDNLILIEWPEQVGINCEKINFQMDNNICTITI